jgi:formate dehydrogenase subunit gamma
MATLFRRVGIAVATILLLVVIGLAPAANAQAPSQVNPTASSVQEDKLLQELRRVQGRISIPDDRASVLIQPAGQEWRQFHQVTLQWIGAIAILGMLLVLVIFYLWRGMVRIQAGRSGRTVVRFNGFERFIHWMTAACFVVLAISGLNITFGKSLLLPLMSPEAFTGWSQWLKYAHNYLSFPFTLGVIVIFLMWIGGNIPNRTDAAWIRDGGGLFNPNKHPPAYRFNAGQKVIYWIVVIGGAAVAITGYILMFPFYGDITVAGMQTAQVVHGIVAVLFIAVMLAHIYIGSIGMEGAFEAMGSGEVDVNWAREHHRLWVDEELSGAADAKPRMTPAE